MNYLIAAQSDVGIVKKTNQDSYCIFTANSKKYGNILFAVVCDGMGGLEKGELASATVVKRFSNWFEKTFPILINNISPNFGIIKSEWDKILKRLNSDIGNYGLSNNISLGTTIVATLCVQNEMYVANVGDSRVYKVTDKITRLTNDQSLVAREISAGTLSIEDEETDSRRNVLLQCIGASQKLEPEYKKYRLEQDAVYFLCSDGFRHEIKEKELLGLLSPKIISTERSINDTLLEIINLLKERKEQDNITCVAFKTMA